MFTGIWICEICRAAWTSTLLHAIPPPSALQPCRTTIDRLGKKITGKLPFTIQITYRLPYFNTFHLYFHTNPDNIDSKSFSQGTSPALLHHSFQSFYGSTTIHLGICEPRFAKRMNHELIVTWGNQKPSLKRVVYSYVSDIFVYPTLMAYRGCGLDFLVNPRVNPPDFLEESKWGIF